MIRVTTGSRLHFGLLGLAASSGRSFGGCGLMVRDPAVVVAMRPAADWCADGPLADRALDFARRFAATLPPSAMSPQQLTVEACPPEHVGLGVGTQLGLAVARAMQRAAGLPDLDVIDLARRVGRGERSAVGVHGFAQGGFIVDGGKSSPSGKLAPLVARIAFPKEWRIIQLRPREDVSWYGERERAAFANLHADVTVTQHLCSLVLLGILPALFESDLPAFGSALGEYNALSGALFRPVQGGDFASRAVGDLVGWLHGQGVRGAGQSSWGPTVFGIVGDTDEATALAQRALEHWGEGMACAITAALNRGADCPPEHG